MTGTQAIIGRLAAVARDMNEQASNIPCRPAAVSKETLIVATGNDRTAAAALLRWALQSAGQDMAALAEKIAFPSSELQARPLEERMAAEVRPRADQTVQITGAPFGVGVRIGDVAALADLAFAAEQTILAGEGGRVALDAALDRLGDAQRAEAVAREHERLADGEMVAEVDELLSSTGCDDLDAFRRIMQQTISGERDLSPETLAALKRWNLTAAEAQQAFAAAISLPALSALICRRRDALDMMHKLAGQIGLQGFGDLRALVEAAREADRPDGYTARRERSRDTTRKVKRALHRQDCAATLKARSGEAAPRAVRSTRAPIRAAETPAPMGNDAAPVEAAALADSTAPESAPEPAAAPAPVTANAHE